MPGRIYAVKRNPIGNPGVQVMFECFMNLVYITGLKDSHSRVLIRKDYEDFVPHKKRSALDETVGRRQNKDPC
jgi:hypothetical protein